MDTDIIVYIKTNDIYEDIAEDVETYELGRSLATGKNKKVLD